MEYQIYQALNIALCTDENKYLDTDSHFVHIPLNLFTEYLSKLAQGQNQSQMCVELSQVGTSNNARVQSKIYLSKVEPSFEPFEKNILLPNWVCKKLGVGMDGALLSIRLVKNPSRIKRIKLCGNNSLYVKYDVKTLLERKVEQMRCINLETRFDIGEQGNITQFRVCELILPDDSVGQYGLITNELAIDFDVPDDIKILERKKELAGKIVEKIDAFVQTREEEEAKKKSTPIPKKTGIVSFTDLVKSDKAESEAELSKSLSKNKGIDLELIYDDIVKELETNLSVSISTDKIYTQEEYERDLVLLREIIDGGKQKQTEMENKLKEQMSKNVRYEDEEGNEIKMDCCETKTPIEKIPHVFESKGYVLGNNKVDNEKDTKQTQQTQTQQTQQTQQLTREEIKRLRLQKFLN